MQGGLSVVVGCLLGAICRELRDLHLGGRPVELAKKACMQHFALRWFQTVDNRRDRAACVGEREVN